MRQVARVIAEAFKAGRCASCGNTRTDGYVVYLHGNPIVRRIGKKTQISLAGYPTATTRSRINDTMCVLGIEFHLFQAHGEQWISGTDYAGLRFEISMPETGWVDVEWGV
ncbi:MAG: hypothetical protein KGN80_00160 [Acidobacteriota bacterium]|nr:hypothetical protein [Acidobacteriota bacterium]